MDYSFIDWILSTLGINAKLFLYTRLKEAQLNGTLVEVSAAGTVWMNSRVLDVNMFVLTITYPKVTEEAIQSIKATIDMNTVYSVEDVLSSTSTGDQEYAEEEV